MKMLLQIGSSGQVSSGQVPAPLEKRFIINLKRIKHTLVALISLTCIAHGQSESDPIVSAGVDQEATLGSSGFWSPTNIATAAWYDAADTGTVIQTGGAVSQWSDKSGNNNHALQGNAAVSPTTETATLGGQNAIAFRIGDGTQKQFLSAPNTASLNLDASGGANVFAVMRYLGYLANGATGNAALSKGNMLSSPSTYGILITSGNGIGYKAAPYAIATAPASVNQEILFTGTGDRAAKTARVFINGELVRTTIPTGDFVSDNTHPLHIGRDAGTGRYAEVDFGEIIVIGGALLDESRQKIEGYLAHKWDRAGSLPATHPYKEAAPPGFGVIVNLAGSATDPSGGTLTTLWTLQAGPGTVIFGDASAVSTTATFFEPGAYVLRLTADNGATQIGDDVAITIFPDENMPSAAPTGLVATPGESAISLDWDDHPDPAVVSYTVYRSQGAGGNGFVAIATGLTSSQFTDGTAPNDVTYLYRITALKGNGAESLPSGEASATAEGPLLVSAGPGGLVYQPYANEGQTNTVNTVPDFSRAGYMGGGAAIPFVPVAVALSPSGGNDTTAIQNAINNVSALPLINGFRGAVYLNAGDYTVSSTLNVNASGVVIRGAGQQDVGGTRITYTATTQSDLLHFRGSSNPAVVAGSTIGITDAYVPVGSRTLNVTDASAYAPGNMIRITNLMNQKWVDDIGMTVEGGLIGDAGDPVWNPAGFQLAHIRYVIAVNGNEITLDAPVVQAIETLYGGGKVEKLTYAGAIENVGIENIRLESTFAHDDDELHGWRAIEMVRVRNGWVRQVTSRYFGWGLVNINIFSLFVTVEDSACLDPKSITTGGRKYSFNVNNSTYNLVQRCLTRGGRHDYVSGSITHGPNVFVDSLATQANSDTGPHFRYATGQLYDNIKSNHDINVRNRLNSGTSHGWAGAQIMFWNVEAHVIRSDAPTGAMNWSIGTTGTKAPGAPALWEPFGIWQSLNVPVTPRSLYYTQLAERLGERALRNVILPEQLSGRIWTELQNWDGNGRLLGSVVCWADGIATIDVDDAINIYARIRDLGILENLSSTTWSMVSGPGSVAFGDESLLETTATFSVAGTYVLRLTAFDGMATAFDEVTITVISAGTSAITYDGNGNTSGVAPVDPQSPYTTGSNVTVQGAGTLARTGHTLTGWNSSADGSGIAYAPSSTLTLNANTTLFARWNAQPLVNAGPDQTISLTGASWSPLELAPGLWLDAADTSSLTLNGTAVSQWGDKSGNNRHATQGNSTNQPLRTPTGLNGMSVVTFDGSNDFFSVDLDFLAGTSHTAFIVTKATHFSNIYGAATDAQGSNSLHIGFNGANYRMNFWSNDFGPARSANFVADSANIVNYAWNQGVGKQIFANGKSEGSNTNAGTIGTMSGGGRIGHTTTGSQTAFGGDIAEIIIIPSNISVADREKIEGYLAHKWGLAGNLAAAHPYKTVSPSGATAVATLAGSATDPENDPLTTLWSVLQGPGSVLIADPSNPATTATFSQEGTYILRLTASDGLNTAFDDVTITVTDTVQETFSNWIAGFDLSERTGFNDDYNHDGVSNGIKYFFGIDPTVPSPGLSALPLDMSDWNKFSFAHPMGENVPADIHAEYRWSKDLSVFHNDGVSDEDGTTVTFARGEPVDGMVAVTATINGTPTDRMFVTLVVSQNE